ncbi:MAG: TIGR00730 family Rossman fold protein [Burkholderiaceae bacterium]
MKINGKNVPRLRQVTDVERATTKKARESWHMFTIMAEFIESTERLSELRPAVSMFGSARIPPDNPYYTLAVQIARRLSDAGFAVISGGGPGIMEAANRGAYEGKSSSVGLNIELPHEECSNAWQDISLSFRHFFARKVAFVKYADAYIVLPGGFGTLDEMSEVLTLIQTGKSRRIPVILVGAEFWSGLLDWFRNRLVADRMIGEHDMELIQLIDDPEQILDAIVSFYEAREAVPTETERQTGMLL